MGITVNTDNVTYTEVINETVFEPYFVSRLCLEEYFCLHRCPGFGIGAVEVFRRHITPTPL